MTPTRSDNPTTHAEAVSHFTREWLTPGGQMAALSCRERHGNLWL
jgi:hypothetical protein